MVFDVKTQVPMPGEPIFLEEPVFLKTVKQLIPNPWHLQPLEPGIISNRFCEKAPFNLNSHQQTLCLAHLVSFIILQTI